MDATLLDKEIWPHNSMDDVALERVKGCPQVVRTFMVSSVAVYPGKHGLEKKAIANRMLFKCGADDLL